MRSYVAEALATTAPAKAMRLARSITYPPARARAVFRVTLTDARRSEEGLRRASGRLLAFARTVETPEHRASWLARLAEAWTDLNVVPPKALQDELRSIVRHLDYRDSTQRADLGYRIRTPKYQGQMATARMACHHSRLAYPIVNSQPMNQMLPRPAPVVVFPPAMSSSSRASVSTECIQ